MLKANWKRILLTSLVTLLPLFLGLLLYKRLPERVPIHFNAAGEADGWGEKAHAVFATPLFMLGLHLLCLLLTAADPKNRNIGDKALGLVLWVAPVGSLIVGAMVYTTALGLAMDVNLFGSLSMGLLFIVLGNLLPKCHQNYTVGIKIPWTLNDPENWNRTHRFAGKLWIAGGIVIILSSFAGTVLVMLAVLLVLALLPVIYSYVLYRRSVG